MRIYYGLLFFLGPRLAFLYYWFSSPRYVNQVFNGWSWPALGVIVLPWMTLVYVLAYGYNAIAGSDWLWLGAGFAVDLATYTGAVYYRVKGENAINPMKWIERSLALRIFLYVVVLAVGILPAIFIVAALIGDGAIFPGFWVNFLAAIFLIYLFLGFLFSFIDPTKPWLPALLLSVAGLLFGGSFSGSIVIFVIWGAGAAAIGAYLGAFLLNRGKTKASLGLQE